MLKRLFKRAFIQRLAAWLLARYLWLCYRTTRFDIVGAEHAARLRRSGRPYIVALWHEHLALMGFFWRRPMGGQVEISGRPPLVLVSQHRDGALIGRVLGNLGMGAIAGSSSRGGSAALKAMVEAIERGHCIGITPDGPRGPRRQAEPGVVALAAMAQVPVLAVAVVVRRHKRLRSWDRMRLPLPFTRGAFAAAAPVTVAREADEAARAAALEQIAAAMNAASAAAEAGAGIPPETDADAGAGARPEPAP
ncbi:MAG: lysophospholipid acyltransferase family protein [Alphaproteobacteria bacterium]|nr:lysophospholipid acyltransferase family protein [Alphaproteobacteria bacterium]